MSSSSYDHHRLESKFRTKWDEEGLYALDVSANVPRKFYVLMMFPYPSAKGLHVGNMYAFTGADVFGRFTRMRGHNVFEPIGLDGFGIHSENYAIKIGRHPLQHAEISQKNFYRQLAAIGNAFNWDYRLETYDPAYYKWTQWLFTEAFRKGLAYKDTTTVNWCPDCKTVLADEQVENGSCERCKHEVERREMSAWYFKITDYAERLLANIEKIDWPETIKIAQRQWIGKKEGIEIAYPMDGTDLNIRCFTTRPDTNFGATFIVVAPEYARENLVELVNANHRKAVSDYIEAALNKSEQQRKIEGKQKTGVFTGLYAVNRLNNKRMPVWVSDFILAGFGTGAVVGVPGHDKRDFEFATKFGLDVVRVVVGRDGDESEITDVDQVFEDYEGVVINSEFLNGLDCREAIRVIMDHIEENGWGQRTVSYHLRDWGISRQRYWGPPIPMIFCEKCGWVAVPTQDLPVVLPAIEDFKPRGDGTSPLSNAPDEWKYPPCPNCGTKAKRELDVSDTFLDSAWYFLAYPNLHTEEWNGNSSPLNHAITKDWLPVDVYIAGAEHAVLHLLYARFMTMMLHDLGHLDFEEPFPFLFGHGLIIKDGAKMSKSKGNIIVPEAYLDRYGADTFRAYLMFLAPFSQGGDFRDSGVSGMRKFLDRVWKLVATCDPREDVLTSETKTVLNKTIKKVTEDIGSFKYNTALAAMMELVNHLRDTGVKSKLAFKPLVQLLAPIAPFLAEGLWTEVLGEAFSVHQSTWPVHDPDYVRDSEVQVAVQVNGKLRGTITLDAADALKESVVSAQARDEEAVSKWLHDKDNLKVIFVPGKIINFVTPS